MSIPEFQLEPDGQEPKLRIVPDPISESVVDWKKVADTTEASRDQVARENEARAAEARDLIDRVIRPQN